MSKPLIEGGYILLSRKLIESEIMSKPPLYLKIWVWLLLNAQHTNYKGLERGSYKTSIPDIMDAMTYYVGYRKERPTKKEIFGVIEWLRNPHEGNGEGSMMVTTKVTHGFVYKVQNYSVYQEPKNYEGNDEGLTKVPMISNGGNNNNKNGFKNVKNDKKKDMTIFEEARKLFPGNKRGLETEYDYLRKKHTDWEVVIPLLKPAIEAQIAWRQNANGEFRPPWKDFKSWTYNRYWELVLTEPEQAKDNTMELLDKIHKAGGKA